jgi:hypothetical protein
VQCYTKHGFHSDDFVEKWSGHILLLLTVSTFIHVSLCYCIVTILITFSMTPISLQIHADICKYICNFIFRNWQLEVVFMKSAEVIRCL